MHRGDLVRLKPQYRLVGPMNLWDEWKSSRGSEDDYAPETFKYFYENDVAMVLEIEERKEDIVRGIKLLTTRSDVGWISENLIEVLNNR